MTHEQLEQGKKFAQLAREYERVIEHLKRIDTTKPAADIAKEINDFLTGCQNLGTSQIKQHLAHIAVLKMIEQAETGFKSCTEKFESL
jgi:hypothetical protein